MLVCNSCNRHYRAEDGRCPFCGTSLQTVAAPSLAMTAALVLGLAMFACGKEDEGGEEADSTGTESGGETGTATITDTNESGGADYGGPDTTVGDTTTDTSDTGTADYGGPDTTGGGTTDTGTTDTGTDTTDSTTDTAGADYGGPDTTSTDSSTT